MFDGPKYQDNPKQYLTREQVNRIEAFAKETPSLELSFCATWFVIGCYTGLRYSDMQAFSEKKNIKDGRLIVHTVKTGELVSMPISEKMRSLFDRVNWKPLHYTNQAYNRFLKSIAALCNIDMPIAAHFSRHTAAMLWANAKISQEVAAKLLGHTTTKTTAIYYKISGQRVDEELKKLE